MEGIYEMDNKNNLVSTQLGVKYPHSISNIFTCHRNNNTVFANAYVCRCRGCIIVSKRFFNRNRSIDIRIPAKSIALSLSLLSIGVTSPVNYMGIISGICALFAYLGNVMLSDNNESKMHLLRSGEVKDIMKSIAVILFIGCILYLWNGLGRIRLDLVLTFYQSLERLEPVYQRKLFSACLYSLL